MNGIKAYNNHPIINNNQTNPLSGNFNGVNNPAVTPLDSGVGQMASSSVKQGFDIKQYIVPGILAIAECLGIGGLCDWLSKPAKESETSRFNKMGEKIDNALAWIKNNTPEQIKKFFQTKKEEILAKHESLKLNKESAYGENLDAFTNGARLRAQISNDPRNLEHFFSSVLGDIHNLSEEDLAKLKPDLTKKDIAEMGHFTSMNLSDMDEHALQNLGITTEEISKIKNMPEMSKPVKEKLLALCEKIKETPAEELKALGLGVVKKEDNNILAQMAAIPTKIEHGIIKILGKDPVIENIKHMQLDASKIKIMEEEIAGKSAFSKWFIKSSLGFGKMMGGNGANVLMQGFFLISTMKSTLEAPKKQKISTLLNDLLGWVSFITLWPVLGKGITGLAGYRKLGEKDKSIKTEGYGNRKLEDAIKEIKSKLSESAIKGTEKKALRVTLNNLNKEAWGNCKFHQKILKALGVIIGYGYDGKGMLNGFKSAPTTVLRVAILMSVAGLCEKPFRALVNAIFGKPYDPDAKKDKAKQLKKPTAKINTAVNPAATANAMTRFLNATKNSNTEKLAETPSNIKNTPQAPDKYLPSPYPKVNLDTKGNDEYNKALNQLDKSEKQAQQVLQEVNRQD